MSRFVTLFLLFLIRFYQLLLSPLLGGHYACRFSPSCSHYAREAVLQYGAFRGSWLALKRLCRCHPLARPGHDPVPGLDYTEPKG